jgi:hypothetical protein
MTFHLSLARIRRSMGFGRDARRPRRLAGRLLLGSLGYRTLPSVVLPTVPTWIAEGPAPNSGGNAQGTSMSSENGVPNSPEDTGAIEAIAVNPGNAKIVFSPSPGEDRGRPAVKGIGPARGRSPSRVVRTIVRAGEYKRRVVAGVSPRGIAPRAVNPNPNLTQPAPRGP